MNRRGFITGLASALVAAPAIVRAGSLMPVKLIDFDLPLYGISPAMDVLPAIAELQERIRAALYADLFRVIAGMPPPPKLSVADWERIL